MLVCTSGTPTVSVVVPLFNKLPYIRRCLKSVLGQTFTDYELIVIDDGSTDGSADAVYAIHDGRLRVLQQVNRGAGAARNAGIAEAKGRLVAFLDADDEWMPDFLHAMVALAVEYPQAGIYVSGLRRSLGGGKDLERTLRTINNHLTGMVTTYFECVHEGDFVTSSNAVIPRRIFDQVGYFAEGEPIGEDGDLWARIVLKYPVAYNSRILAVYHSDAAGRSFARSGCNPPFPPVVRTLRRQISEGQSSDSQRRVLEGYIDWRLINYAYWLLELGHRDQLLRFFRQERFVTLRYRAEALLLYAVLLVLPVRYAYALKWKVTNLYRWCKRVVRGGDAVWSGRTVLTRYIPSNPRGASDSNRSACHNSSSEKVLR
jgi:glycosyltransferase involved in cell wall biosynthesis